MERISLAKQLKKRLLLILSVVIIILIVSFFVMRYIQMLDLIKSSMRAMAMDVQNNYVDSVLGDRSMTERSALRFTNRIQNDKAVIQILNTKNQVIASTGFYDSYKIKEDYKQIDNATLGRLLVYNMPLKNNIGIDVGSVSVITQIDALDQIVLTEGVTLFLILVFTTMFIYVFITLFVNNMLKRLDFLKTVSQHFANRDFTEQAPVLPYDEIGELGEVMNYMAGSWQEHNEKRSEYVAQTAHDLKTPLTVIMTWVDFLRDHPISLDEGLQIIGSESQKMKHLANVMVSAYTREDEPMFFVHLRIDTFIKSEMAKWHLSLKRHRVEVIYNIVPIKAEIDQYRMGQVIFNLVDNVIKHTPEKTKIKITTIDDTSHYRIVFEDDGARNKAFTDVFKGSQLGLKSVAKIIEAHNGTLVTKQVPEKGMSILMTMPYLQKRKHTD